MSASTSHEKRQKTIRRLIVLGLFSGVVLFFFLSQVARSDALAAIGLLENLRDAKGATATVAVTLLIFLAIIENAEKLHFLWEMGHKLLGYDLEAMAKHEREFTDLPEDYVRRPAMERALATQLAPSDEPKLVVFTEEHDAGKTTIMNYVIPRQLTRRYHGNIIYCRGDMQSIEAEISESDEQRRRRLAKRVFDRVIRHAEVPGDTGETLQGKSEAISEYFDREGKQPWLIIIDQIDSPDFPYLETLPALFGQCNTIVVVSNRVNIPQRAYTRESEDGDERVILRQDMHLQPFTADEAMTMFRSEVRERRGTLHHDAVAALKSRLEGAWPGTIQRLSDIYVNGGGASGVERALNISVRGVRRVRVINSTIVDELPGGLRHFLAGLALLAGSTVGETTLSALAANNLCEGMALTTLIDACRRRQYLTPYIETVNSRKDVIPQRFTITKLGRGIANRALLSVGHDAELRLGSTLLGYFREIEMYRAPREVLADLANILGMMSWAETISHLPEKDVIRFTRHIRDALYRSGQWDIGLSWLAYSERAAARLSLQRAEGELASAQAQLLIASGKATSALAAVDVAHRAFADSILRAESELALGVVAEEIAHAAIDFDELQRCWLAHLRCTARMALLSSQHDIAALDNLHREVEDAISWLATHECVAINAAVAALFTAMLKLDRVRLTLWKGDMQFRKAQHTQADSDWRTAQALLRDMQAVNASSSEQDTETVRNLLAEMKRTEAAVFRRFAARSHSVLRLYWYVRANRLLTESLQVARGIRLEEVLTRLESAELQLVGITLLTRRWKPGRGQKVFRRIITRFIPQWYRLQASYRQLLVANADSASLGAQTIQFTTLRTLAMVTNQLARLERNESYLRASDEYLRSAESIAYRLRLEMPNLWESMSSTLTFSQWSGRESNKPDAVRETAVSVKQG